MVRKAARYPLFFGARALFVLGAGIACSPADGGKETAEEIAAECDSARTHFAREVWAPVMGQICIDCHAPGGLAPAEGADFELAPPGYPGFLDANFREVQRVARLTFDGKSQLLRKPLGEMNHGGNQVLQEDSAEYAALAEFVGKLESLDECETEAPPPALPSVTLAGPAATLRKASLHLTGELPSPASIQSVVDGGEPALPGALMDLMDHEGFYTRLQEIYNDVLLTDKYLAYNGFALNLLNDQDYPIAGDYYDTLPDDVRRDVNLSVAREPLELITYIVKNDRPFTEILTADFTVVNSATAQVYNIDPPSGTYDYGTFREARRLVQRDGALLEPPHAGILTSPMILNRFPTTPTNRSRHRSRKIFELFLATDILEVAERPIDPTESAQYINPTRDDAACNQCHRLIDPVAGAFMKFDENDVERFRPDAEWHPEMFAPGFGDEVMELADFDNGPSWLAARIVADPRFPLSVVYTMFRALTGHDPVKYPDDSSATDYDARLAAWESQEATFRAIVAQFVDSNYNLKVAIREVLLSPYFRVIGVADGASAADVAQLDGVGTARLSTPERLSQKIEAVTGVPWARGWDGSPWLSTDYRILYGGIDSDTVVTRLERPNGIMAAVQLRLANEVSCAATAWDFMQPQADRHLFRHVEPSDTPDAGSDAIKKNIQYLHAQILGEDLSLDDPEIARTYALFEQTYREGIAKVASEELSRRLTWECQGRRNPITREDLPDAERLVNDESYTIRSWLAVVTYLLSDFQFLYE